MSRQKIIFIQGRHGDPHLNHRTIFPSDEISYIIYKMKTCLYYLGQIFHSPHCCLCNRAACSLSHLKDFLIGRKTDRRKPSVTVQWNLRLQTCRKRAWIVILGRGRRRGLYNVWLLFLSVVAKDTQTIHLHEQKGRYGTHLGCQIGLPFVVLWCNLSPHIRPHPEGLQKWVRLEKAEGIQRVILEAFIDNGQKSVFQCLSFARPYGIP